MSNIVNPDLLLDVGDEVPGFTLDSNVGNIMFREIIYGRWCLLITFDQAFEPAATTDLGMVGKLKEEFDDRDILVLVIGKDSGSKRFARLFAIISFTKIFAVGNIRQWIRDIEELNSTRIEFAVMSDPSGSIMKMVTKVVSRLFSFILYIIVRLCKRN
jgi:alkyl hydroperoxide reductase subunit AhpC